MSVLRHLLSPPLLSPALPYFVCLRKPPLPPTQTRLRQNKKNPHTATPPRHHYFVGQVFWMSCHSESLLLIKFLCPPSAMLLPAEPLANQPEKTFCLFFRPNPPPRMLKAFLRTSSLLYLNFCFSLLFLSHTCVHDSKEISSLAVKRKQKKKWPVTNKKKKRKLEKKMKKIGN